MTLTFCARSAIFFFVLGCLLVGGAWAGREVHYRQSLPYQIARFIVECDARDQESIVLATKKGLQATCQEEAKIPVKPTRKPQPPAISP